MTNNQPYLLRAFFDWILDNQLTPYMAVDANYPGVQIPTQFVNNGQIILNVSPSACLNFSIDLEWVQFQARFSGQAMQVSFPCEAVAAIYAKENNAGTAFQVPPYPETIEDNTDIESPALPNTSKEESKDTPKDKSKPKPSLRIVK